MSEYLFQIAVAFDRMVNAILGGSCDETLSSRAYRGHRDGRYPGLLMKPLIDGIFFWQGNHCEQSFQYEHDRWVVWMLFDTAGRPLAETIRKGD